MPFKDVLKAFKGLLKAFKTPFEGPLKGLLKAKAFKRPFKRPFEDLLKACEISFKDL